MSYVTLGSRGPQTAKIDNTGLNPGNWTVAFTPDIVNVNLSQFEVYKIIVFCAKPTLVTFDVYVDRFKWDTGVYGNRNSWDPSQPLILRPGQTLSFPYSNPATDGFPPVVTIWLRYDPSIATQTEGQLWVGKLSMSRSYSPEIPSSIKMVFSSIMACPDPVL